MSYIRSGSNPESLYIWADSGNTIHISNGNSDEYNTIPEKVFHGLIRKWIRQHEEDTEFKGASVKSVLVKNKKEKVVNIILSYDDWRYNMWEVTWYYIVHENIEKINRGYKTKVEL